APKATGNIATEDLVFMLDRSNVASGLDLEKLIAVNHWFAEIMGRPLPSMVGKAGGFKAAA
ncbi:MAG TPA: hydroxymethylglutaryl-CoA lyase, partial [Polymorphobacter sp.]|nr:hydroxymethylglutaryl-CoA lyase [Polymorphobacter sp.]